MAKSGSLHNVFRAGKDDVFQQVSLSLQILPMGFLLWLWKSKEDFGSEVSSENHGKSLIRERWNLIWTFGHHFLSSTLNIRLKYDLSRPGETCRCSNDCLRIFSVADFGTLKSSWEMRETPFGETDFRAMGPWLAAQMTQTIVPQVVFWWFSLTMSLFLALSLERASFLFVFDYWFLLHLQCF